MDVANCDYINHKDSYLADSEDGAMPMDDLRVAAMLGKKLLEKNSNLERKLRQLENFAEDTMETNQALLRQLNEAKQSLSMANKSCARVELRLEEVEMHNKELEARLNKKDVTLQLKGRIVDDLQAKLEALKLENSSLQEALSKSRLKNGEIRTHSRSLSGAGLKSTCSGDRQPSTELNEMVDELTTKLQNITYQKNKLELQLATLHTENSKLVEIVSKQETEIGDLQNHIKFLEEVVAGGCSQPTTPHLLVSPKGTPSHSLLVQATDPTLLHSIGGESSLDMSLSERNSKAPHGVTLFSELQTEFNTLQSNFENIIRNCSCPASSAYKTKETNIEETDTPLSSQAQKVKWSSSQMKGLFDEVYATLKQTTVVADQLIEKRNEKKRGSI